MFNLFAENLPSEGNVVSQPNASDRQEFLSAHSATAVDPRFQIAANQQDKKLTAGKPAIVALKHCPLDRSA
jgi:hypothetical protein